MIGLYEKLCIIIGMVKNNKTNNKKINDLKLKTKKIKIKILFLFLFF